jgi:hypothetical protein
MRLLPLEQPHLRMARGAKETRAFQANISANVNPFKEIDT